MPAKQRGSWPKVYKKIKDKYKATFFSLSESRCLPASTLKPEEREFVVDSGASMHMISKKDLNDAEMDTLTKSCSPTIVITANGEVQTHEEATVYVRELEIFLTLKVLENTPAVLSLGKLCDENGYSYEWINISFKTGFGYNATRRTSFLSWFQACQRVLPLVLTLQPQRHSQDRRGIVLHLLRARLVHQLQVTVRLEKERIKVQLIPPQCMCQVLRLMIERGDPLFAVNPITSKVAKPTRNTQKQIERRP